MAGNADCNVAAIFVELILALIIFIMNFVFSITYY
jgi:hypothetical protein